MPLRPSGPPRIAALLLLAVLLPAWACAGRGAKVDDIRSTPPEFAGYVYQRSGEQFVPVVNARVWTQPFSDDVVTDSAGYFSIRRGLVPGSYTVFAEARGQKSQQTRVRAALGETTGLRIDISVASVVWRPGQYDPTSGKGSRGPGEVGVRQP
jgi:hypothetical protein